MAPPFNPVSPVVVEHEPFLPPGPAPIIGNEARSIQDFVSQYVTLDQMSAQRLQELYEEYMINLQLHGGPAGRRFRVEIMPSAPPSSSSGGSNVYGIPELASLEHVASLPIVFDTMLAVRRTYQEMKGGNCLVRLYLNAAEAIVDSYLKISRPFWQSMFYCLSRPIRLADNVLLRSMELLEEKVPAVVLPPDQILVYVRETVGNKLNFSIKFCSHCIGILLTLHRPGRLERIAELEAFVNHWRLENQEQLQIQNGNADMPQPALIQENEGNGQIVGNHVNAALRDEDVNAENLQPVQNNIDENGNVVNGQLVQNAN